MKKKFTKKKFITGIVSILLLIAALNFDDISRIIGYYYFEEAVNLSPPYEVVRVVDGDTIIIDMDGTKERVRLIGLDAPESTHPDEERNTEYGEISSEFTREALEGKKVSLEYDLQERDKYGRILAYVYKDKKMFNKILIMEGHAKAVTYPPNVKYTDEFIRLEKEAKKSQKGLWYN